MNCARCGRYDCDNIRRISVVRDGQFYRRAVNVVNKRIPVPVGLCDSNIVITAAPAIVINTHNTVLCVIRIILCGMAVRRALQDADKVVPVI